MQRLALSLALVVLLFVAAGSHLSAAQQITVFNGSCFSGPDNTLINCATLTPTAVPVLPEPVKDISVGPGNPGPFNTIAYPVTVTSQFLCFALDEPINVFALGSPAALTLLSPDPAEVVQPNAQSLTTKVDPVTGLARLNLEVRSDAIGPGGLTVKAVWPSENVERIDTVITPNPTATATPGTNDTPTPTDTATPAPTDTPVATPAAGTATATAVPTATSVPGPFTVSACMQPSVLSGKSLGGDSATLYGQTAPGATCSAGISYFNTPNAYLDGPTSDQFDGGNQTAAADGLVSFPLTENSTADYGIGLVTCAAPSGGPPQTACAAFLIAQTGTQDLLNADAATTGS